MGVKTIGVKPYRDYRWQVEYTKMKQSHREDEALVKYLDSIKHAPKEITAQAKILNEIQSDVIFLDCTDDEGNICTKFSVPVGRRYTYMETLLYNVAFNSMKNADDFIGMSALTTTDLDRLYILYSLAYTSGFEEYLLPTENIETIGSFAMTLVRNSLRYEKVRGSAAKQVCIERLKEKKEGK